MSLCQICLNPKRKTRFDSSRITICQWCVSELIKPRCISPHSYIATLSENFEDNESRKITRLKNLAESSVAPPIYPEADINNSNNWALDLIRQKEGFLEAVYRNLIDDKTRQHEAQKLSAIRRQDLISSHNAAIALYTQKLNEIAKARDEYPHLEASIAARIDKFINNKFESLKTSGQITLPNDRLLRAYQLGLINWDNEVSSRQDNESYDQLRHFIKAQDGHACVICDKPKSKSELHIHHIIPLSRFGTNQHVNLVTLCLTCHNKQHATFDITKDKPQKYNYRQQDSIFVALSIQTTGDLETDDIIEISAARFENGVNRSRFQSFVYSDRYQPELLGSSVRIPKQTILAAEKPSTVFEKLLEFVGESNIVFHNSNYVLNFFLKYPGIHQTLSRRTFTDILKIAEKRKLGLKDNKISTLLEYLKTQSYAPSYFVERQECINIGLAFIALSKTAAVQSDKKKITISSIRERKKSPLNKNKALLAIQPEKTMDYAYHLYQKQNYHQAFDIYLKFAKEGNAVAQYNLGIMYANAQGVKNNDQHAVYCYQKAADQGYANAEYNLGFMYANGRGVEKNDQKAMFWYHKAADQRDASAQYNLGSRYENGRGVEKDEQKAVFWYRKAADQGNADARDKFLKLYRNLHTDKADDELIDLYHEALAFGAILDANIYYKILFERSYTRLNNDIYSVTLMGNSRDLNNSLGFKEFKGLIDEYHEALSFGIFEIAKEIYVELEEYQRNGFRNRLEAGNITYSKHARSFDELLDEYHESICFGYLETAFELFQLLIDRKLDEIIKFRIKYSSDSLKPV